MSTIDVKQLTKKFNGQTVLHGIDLQVNSGEVVAIIGPSGSGKTTLLRSINLLEEPNSGTITVGNIHIDGSRPISKQKENVRKLRQQVGFVFQNFNLFPHRSVLENIIEGPVIVKGEPRDKAVAYARQLLEKVGLLPEHAERYPHEFSGGQRQRICIARALALNPKVVIADESVSALDVSIQAQIVNLLMDLQREFGIAFLFISHDMAVVERISHRVAVMYLGQIVEIGPRRAVFEHPQHAYTRKLMAAVPVADPSHRRQEQTLLVDDIPSPIHALHNEPEVLPLVQVGAGHFVARHRVGGLY